MTPAIAAPLLTVLLLSVSQLLPCARTPTKDYERYVRHVEKRKCKWVYRDLSSDSQSRLDAYLEVLRDLSLAAYDQADPDQQSASNSVAADGGMPSLDAATETDAGLEDAGAEGSQDPAAPSRPFADLREMEGEDLFVALCKGKPADLPTLYRERGLADSAPFHAKRETRDGDSAEVFANATKDKKKKDKKGDGQAEPEESSVKLVMDRGRFRVVLSPMGIEWAPGPEGRLLPRFHSPILTLGVETDGQRTPSYAYHRIVEHLQQGRCEEFYAGLDSASRRRIELTVPMMIGFASVMVSDGTPRRAGQDQGKDLVVAMCKKASPQELRATGLHLGEVADERIRGNRASLTIRTTEDEAGPTHQVMMVREDGQWHLSIEAFSELVEDTSDEQDSEEGEDEEDEE